MTAEASIVLPAYNQAHYLPAALDGVFAQTYPHYELIVVNDGSTDGTADVLAQYQHRYDFTVITQQNQGLPRALNAGFARTHGRYLTWTSSDNVMLPTMLDVLVQALVDDPSVGLVYADFHVIDDKGSDWGRFNTVDYDPYWLLYANLVHCCFLYRRECMERAGGYDPKFIYGEDWEYWIRVSQYYGMKRVPEALYLYRLHRSSMTAEIKQGTALKMSHAEFAARIRRRMPARWMMLMLKRCWALLSRSNHPVISEGKNWLLAVALCQVDSEGPMPGAGARPADRNQAVDVPSRAFDETRGKVSG